MSAQHQRLLPLCPEFLIELLSLTNSWEAGVAKMQEYQNSANQLGWLIDSVNRRVAVYRLGQTVEILQPPETLSSNDLFPGFALNLQIIWI